MSAHRCRCFETFLCQLCAVGRTYQYPGFNRVQQATGQVIRTETDRGIIVLIDDRFTHARYRQLFPSHWRGYQVVQSASEIKDKLTRFWHELKGP